MMRGIEAAKLELRYLGLQAKQCRSQNLASITLFVSENPREGVVGEGTQASMAKVSIRIDAQDPMCAGAQQGFERRTLVGVLSHARRLQVDSEDAQISVRHTQCNLRRATGVAGEVLHEVTELGSH
jgi:hypothetical protein